MWWQEGLRGYTSVSGTPGGNVPTQISILIILSLFLFQVDGAKVVTHFDGNGIGQVGNGALVSGEEGGGGQAKR